MYKNEGLWGGGLELNRASFIKQARTAAAYRDNSLSNLIYVCISAGICKQAQLMKDILRTKTCAFYIFNASLFARPGCF